MELLVSDYDGTYTTGKFSMLLNTRTIRKFIDNGNAFVLSSGRSYKSLEFETKINDIPYSYLATCDGSFLFDKDGNNLMYNKMPDDIVREINPIINIGAHKQIEYIHEKSYDPYHIMGTDIAGVSFIIDKLKITDEFKNEYAKIRESHPELSFIVYNWQDEYYFMIKPKNITKSTPIAELGKILQVSKSQIYTIGDNSNDYEMIRDYNGYMIGSDPKLQDVALKKYNSVHELINDINKKKALKRW